MSTLLPRIGAKVRRARGQFAGQEGIVIAGHGPTWLVAFPVCDRAIHEAELELVDLGPFPAPPVAGHPVVGTI